MSTHAELSQLIAAIYDTVLEPDRWGSVLDHLVQHLGAKAGMLRVYNEHGVMHTFDNYSALYRDFFSKGKDELTHDPFWQDNDRKLCASHFNDDHPGFFHLHDCLSIAPSKLLETHKPSRYIYEHYGVVFQIVARLNVSQNFIDTVSFQYDEAHGPAKQAEINRANLLLPHIRKALLLSRVMAKGRTYLAPPIHILDSLDIAVLVVNQFGMLELGSQSAHNILKKHDGIYLEKGGKIGVKGVASQSLYAMIAAVSRGQKTGDALNEQIMIVEREGTANTYVLSISPLSVMKPRIDNIFCGAVITIIDPGAYSRASIRAVELVYRLTSAESEVLAYVIDGASAPEIADLRQVGVETVKSQISSILSKTNVDNRLQLMRLVMHLQLPSVNKLL